ncbi:MAG TPA: hypothetical protein VFP68_14890, partial [Burkholderiaceae bacterium]|nr:hypothetical protein [Burkholderiaceae bacterium]
THDTNGVPAHPHCAPSRGETGGVLTNARNVPGISGPGRPQEARVITLVLNTAATINPLPATAGGSAGSGASWSAGTLLWQAQVVNAWGKTEQQYFGNGVTGKAVFEAATGRTTDLTAGINGGTTVLNQHYSWDSLNNLTARTDANGDGSGAAVSETFGYADNLNRLTSYTVSGPSIPGYSRNVTLQYNALGMLLSKSDVCWCCRHSFAPA